MNGNHQKFLQHLNESQRYVWLAAQMLVDLGYNVKINTSGRATERKDWKKFVDNGDLEISLRIEVKGLGCDFTGPGDWPFKQHFIICAKHSFDQAIPKPYGYMYFNQAGTHVAIVKSSTYGDWYVERRKDSRYEGVEQEFYLTDTSKVTFRGV